VHRGETYRGLCNTQSCWGLVSMIALSTDNIKDFKKKIPYNDIPRTFQDAIVVARSLGVQYLWVDSLCILQSGPGARKDWQTESAQMHRVYENAYCNIAASGSSDSRGGLFYDRNPFDIETTVVRVDWQSMAGNYKIIDTDFDTAHKNRAPLSRRAWVFQEILFAPRVLYCRRQQLF
jgi:hypothetical protein